MEKKDGEILGDGGKCGRLILPLGRGNATANGKLFQSADKKLC